MRRDYDDLLAYLDEAVGDGVLLVIAFNERTYDIIRGEAWYDDYLENTDTRSKRQMYDDATAVLKQTDVSGKLYGTDTVARIKVTEEGTGLFLVPDAYEGAFLWIAPDVDVPVPGFVRECLDRMETLA